MYCTVLEMSEIEGKSRETAGRQCAPNAVFGKNRAPDAVVSAFNSFSR
jgi:hypothetical protein